MQGFGLTVTRNVNLAMKLAQLVLHPEILHVVHAKQDTSWSGSALHANLTALMENMVTLQLTCVCFAITHAELVKVQDLINVQFVQILI